MYLGNLMKYMLNLSGDLDIISSRKEILCPNW